MKKSEQEVQEILSKFVYRARRLHSHSIVQNNEQLNTLANPTIQLSINEDGKGTSSRKLPENEEIFESLVARVRPFILGSESIYIPKILDLLEDSVNWENLKKQQTNLKELRDRWQVVKPTGTHLQHYVMQTKSKDGTESYQSSDIQLADTWLYADLVHSDPHKKKLESLNFSLSERYMAAVTVFAQLAKYIIYLLGLVQELYRNKEIPLEEKVWTEQVVVGSAPLVNKDVTVYVGKTGLSIPDIQDVLTGSGFARLNPKQLIGPRLAVRFDNAEENLYTVTEFSLTDKEKNNSEIFITLEHRVEIKFLNHLEDGFGQPKIEFDYKMNSISEHREAIEIQRNFLAASKIEIRAGSQTLLNIEQGDIDDELLLHLDVLVETLRDLELLGNLLSIELPPLGDSRYSQSQRICLRQIVLMLQGHVLKGPRIQFGATQAPRTPYLVLPENKFNIGKIEVQVPPVAVWHPEQKSKVDTLRDNSMFYTVEPPENKNFLIWMPSKTSIDFSNEMKETASLDLLNTHKR